MYCLYIVHLQYISNNLVILGFLLKQTFKPTESELIKYKCIFILFLLFAIIKGKNLTYISY